jgi:transcriptional regulator with XRE-family HTH domain
MSKLQTWMTRNEKHDADVARLVRISRPQVSRIRRGVHAASEKTARRLETLTGIKWWHFMTIEKKPRASKKVKA